MVFGRLGVLGQMSTLGMSSAAGVTIRVAAPSITSPADDATDIGETPTITTSAFAVTNEGSDTHASTDWQMASDAGFTTIVIQSLADTSNKTSWTVPSGQLTESTEYFVRARHNGTTYGASGWSATVSFTTADAFGYSWTNAEGAAFEAAMSGTYSDAKLALLDTYISNLKSGLTNGTNTWGGHDVLALLFLDNATDALRWFNAPATLMTNNGATHTPGEGYTGNGTSSEINTNYDASINGVQYTQDSACIGVWVRVAGSAGRTIVGTLGATARAYIENLSGTYNGRGPNTGNTSVSFSTAGSNTGLLSLNRSGSAAVEAYYNGSSVSTGSASSTAVADGSMHLLSRGGAAYYDGQVSIFRAGRSFTAAEWADIHAADNALLTGWAAA